MPKLYKNSDITKQTNSLSKSRAKDIKFSAFYRLINKFGANRFKRPVIILVSFIIIGIVILISTKAATTSPSAEAESGLISGNAAKFGDSSSSGGAHIKFGSTVKRFFSDGASWNKTVAELGGRESTLDSFTSRLWQYGGGTTTSAPAPGAFFLSTKDYSVPIYDLNDPTNIKVRVFQIAETHASQELSLTGISVGDEIPWNPKWIPGSGNDKILAAVDYNTGKAYEFWLVRNDSEKYQCFDLFGQNGQKGYDPTNPNHLCVGTVNVFNNLFTAGDNTPGSTYVGRGMGINKLALVVRADEVASGNIGHALPLTVSNPMFGAGSQTPGIIQPTYDSNKRLTLAGSDPTNAGMMSPEYFTSPLVSGAGFTKGFYMKPATRLEHKYGYIGGTITQGDATPVNGFDDSERAKTIPSGMRFALNITETDINTWLAQKGYTGAKKETARTFARAWRDYGAIVAESGGYGISIETDGVVGPAKAKWAELGIPDDGSNRPGGDLLSGLVTASNLYVVKQP